MAATGVEGDDLVVRLSPAERLGALRGGLRVPRTAVNAVDVVDDPFSELRGLRAPGTRIPRVIAWGTWRRPHGRRDLVVVHRGQPGIVVELHPNGAGVDGIILSAPDPERLRGPLTA